MMQHVTTAAWQQNMCTGAYLPMWEGKAYKMPKSTLTYVSALLEERTALQTSGSSLQKPNS